MTTEEIKQKAAQEFPYSDIGGHWNGYQDMKRKSYEKGFSQCYESNCLPVIKENERLRELLEAIVESASIADIPDEYYLHKILLNDIKQALSGKGK